MRFLNNVTLPKNVKRGTLWDFFTTFVLQNILKSLRGDPLVESKKLQKKSHCAEKNPSEKTRGGFYVIDVLGVDVFVVDGVLTFRVCFGLP